MAYVSIIKIRNQFSFYFYPPEWKKCSDVISITDSLWSKFKTASADEQMGLVGLGPFCVRLEEMNAEKVPNMFLLVTEMFLKHLLHKF